ncbi:MAG TPA: beta-propeller fold lactonase family protein [Galbitalea sp.]|nr:beta-propeller fold lactonase family protein [Galbitalea sp.]
MSSSRIWVGGYTEDMNGSAEGIAILRVAPDGSLENRGLAAAADSPSFLASSGDTLYAAGEGARAVTAYRIAGDELHFLGVQDTAGDLPCALAVLGDRLALAVACYGDGILDVHPLAPDGAIGKTGHSLRGAGKGTRLNQDEPHAHAALQVDATTVLSTDLGTDEVYIHTLEGDVLTRIGSLRFPDGSGPRDLLPHPSGVVYLLAELGNEVFVLERADEGYAISGQVALPGAAEGDHAAALALSTDGQFLYSALRGSDNLAVLSVRDDGKTLSPVGAVSSGGGWPRHLVMDGEYLRVANQLTSSVVTFTLGADGLPVQHSSLVVPSPTCLLLG